MSDIYAQLGQRIRKLRKQADLTQAQLAELVGITPDYVGRIERGRGAVTIATLSQIAAALNAPLRQFVDLEEIDSASREQVLKVIQALLRKKRVEELRRVCLFLEALDSR